MKLQTVCAREGMPSALGLLNPYRIDRMRLSLHRQTYQGRYFRSICGLFAGCIMCICVMTVTVRAQDIQQIRLRAEVAEFIVTPDSTNQDVIFINTSISTLTVKRIRTRGGEFIILEAAGLQKIFGEGQPNIPVYSRLIEVPLHAELEATVLSYDEERIALSGYDIHEKIIPAQPSLARNQDPEEVPFYYDERLYNRDAMLDSVTVTYEDLGILRNVRLFRVQVNPIQYNPVRNTLMIMNNMRIRIEFIGADHVRTQERRNRYGSVLFDRVLERTVSNFQFEFKPLIDETITFVIVSDRIFETTLEPFVTWKEVLGYNVIEAYTDDLNVGNTTASIRTYLQNLFNNPPSGMNPPHYVLFVGDVAQIPAFNGTAGGNHVTDFYYCEYTGDNLPEVYYGRFSATTTAQLQPQIDKTTQYEQYSMPDPSYLTEAVLVAGADAFSHALTYGNGQINYGTSMYFNAANGITAHVYLQPEPTGGTYSADIIADVNNGIGIANYTAHCDPTGWSNPSFTTNDIPGLTNTNQYGLWIGNCCRSNRFNVEECFGEAALRAQNRGAMGYIGATDYTYWDEDFWWAVGFKNVTANPVYDANQLGAYDRLFHTSGEPTSEWYTTQGQILVGGNLAVFGSTSTLDSYYAEIYHLMGDPSVDIRVRLPAAMDVVHASSAPTSNNHFKVAVKQGFVMIPGATVTLMFNNQVVDSKETEESYPDRGTATFAYNLSPGPMTIYVTKSNYVPYSGTCNLSTGIGEWWISLHGGATYPYEEWYEDTFCFNSIVNIEYHFKYRWAIVLEVAYNEFRWREQPRRFPWWNLSGTFRYYYPLRRMRVFINAGPGIYLPDEGNTRVGIKTGLGINIPLGDRLILEAGSDYHTIFASDKETIFQNRNTTFQHFHIGIVYRLK